MVTVHPSVEMLKELTASLQLLSSTNFQALNNDENFLTLVQESADMHSLCMCFLFHFPRMRICSQGLAIVKTTMQLGIMLLLYG